MAASGVWVMETLLVGAVTGTCGWRAGAVLGSGLALDTPTTPCARPCAVGCGRPLAAHDRVGAERNREQRERRRSAGAGHRGVGRGRGRCRARRRLRRVRGRGRRPTRAAAGEGHSAPLQDLRRRHHRSLTGRVAARLRVAAERPGARGHLLAGRPVRPHPSLPPDALRSGQPAGVRPGAGGVGGPGRSPGAHRGDRLPRRAARAGGPRPAHGRGGALRPARSRCWRAPWSARTAAPAG